MFLLQNSRGERFRCVCRVYGHSDLCERRAVIVMLIDEMDRTARFGFFSRDHRFVYKVAIHPWPSEFGKSAGCTFRIRPRNS